MSHIFVPTNKGTQKRYFVVYLLLQSQRRLPSFVFIMPQIIVAVAGYSALGELFTFLFQGLQAKGLVCYQNKAANLWLMSM